MDITIVASVRRQPMITEFVKDYPHIISYTPDFPFVRSFRPRPEYNHLGIRLHVGPYRCFRGHQEALRKTTGEVILVFEDDAVPDDPNSWMASVERCVPLLDKYEVVSLHGRNIVNPTEFELDGIKLVIPGGPEHSKVRWSLGSLAYLVKRPTAERIMRAQYEGLPMDLFLATEFNFCVLKDSDGKPFRHDRQHGSLVERCR